VLEAVRTAPSTPASAATCPSPWATAAGFLARLLAIFAVGRLPLLLVGLWAVSSFKLADGSGPWQEWAHSVPEPWLAMLSRWDGRWYFYVAHDGYSFDPNGESNVGFAPLLPALMALGGKLFGHNSAEVLLGVGAVVGNLALLIALGYLFVLTRRSGGTRLGTRTLLCLLLFPTSVFLSAVYSEAIFLAPAIAAFVYADDERWWLVGVCGALAALGRTYGVLIVVPLAWEYAARHGWRLSAVRQDVLWLGLIPLAFLAWMGHLYMRTGTLFSMTLEEAHRGRSPTWPWDVWAGFSSKPFDLTLDSSHSLADLGFVAGFGVLVVLTWFLKRRSLAIYATLFYLPMISSGLLSSVNRLGLELFPVFIVLGQLTRWRLAFATYGTLAGGLALYLMARFALGYWVG
jgi:Mannosyltransferase (PIG-V)